MENCFIEFNARIILIIHYCTNILKNIQYERINKIKNYSSKIKKIKKSKREQEMRRLNHFFSLKYKMNHQKINKTQLK